MPHLSLPFATALCIAAVVLNGCAIIEGLLSPSSRPKAKVTGARIQDLSLTDLTLLFDVEITNPASSDLPLVALDYDIASDGSNVVSGRADLDGTIPATGSRTIQLPARVTFADVLNVAKGVKPGAVVPYQANLLLSVDVPSMGPLELPLRKDGEFPVPTVPTVELSSVRWESLTLDRAEAVLDLHVVNTNDFEIGLAQLDYSLILGGSRISEGIYREPSDLKPGDNKQLSVGMSISPKSLGLAAFRTLSGSGGDYELAGNLACKTRFGPVDFKYEKAGETSFER